MTDSKQTSTKSSTGRPMDDNIDDLGRKPDGSTMDQPGSQAKAEEHPEPADPHPSDEDRSNVYNPSPGGDTHSETKDRSIDRLRKNTPGSPA
jgi:hypothetical protein